jgi:DNA-binding CsgD family transcriptional regulator
VKSAFLSATRRLGADAQALAVLVALDDLGDLGPIAEAARALGVDPAALDELEAAELVAVDEGTVAFRHPLMRSAVQGGATTRERSRAHRALAAALDGDVHAARRAWHRAAAAPGPDAAVADELVRAGEEARRRGAQAVAATAFERASLLSVATETRAERLLLAAEATWEAGAVSRVGPLLDRADALPLDNDDRSTAELLRAALALERGHAAEAFELFLTAASRVARTDSARALRALAGAAEASWWLGRRGLLAEVRGVYEQMAVEPGTVGHFFVDVLAGTERLLAFDFPGGVAALRRALGLAAELPAGNELMTAYAAIHLGDPVEAHAQYARAVARLRAAGNLRELPFALTLQAAMECWLGAIPAAASHAAESLRLAEETGQPRSGGYAHAILAHVVALQGDEAACREHVRAAEDSVLGGLALQAGTVRWALGRLELGLGRSEAALTHLAAIQDAGDAPLNALFSTPDLIEAAVSAGRLDQRCLDAYEHFVAWDRAAGGRWHRGVAERMRGLLDQDASSADACFARSHEALGAAFPYDQARTRLAWGETRRRSRRRVDSREHLRAALALFETIGARPWADRARDELRATGEIAAQSSRPGLDVLTPQERQIAELVSGGATNRDIGDELFLSVRTVEYHLHKMFRKLGLASRHALARLVLEDAEERRSSMLDAVPSLGTRGD